jgi:hypothetical protein
MYQNESIRTLRFMSSTDQVQTSFLRAAVLAMAAATAAAVIVGLVAPLATAASKPRPSKPGTSKPASSKLAAAAPTASGSITVNGVTTKMLYGSARLVKGFFDPTKNDVEVLLSDVPLAGTALTDGFERDKLAKNGKAHIFEITIDASGTPISTAFRHSGFSGPPPSGVDSSDVLTKTILSTTDIAARYRSTTPKEFFGDTFGFDVSFHLPISPKAK